MIQYQVKNRVRPAVIEAKVGKRLTGDDYDVLMHGPTKVTMPDGRPLCVYLPGVLRDVMEAAHPILTTIRARTDNRANASGSQMIESGKRDRAKMVASSILGSFDRTDGGINYHCRLTAFNADKFDQFQQLVPIFQAMQPYFERYVPERYEAQMQQVGKTSPDWIIPGTPFTTITVNHTYPTGVHMDKGDLDAGYSMLTTLCRGPIAGGYLVFPEYRLAAPMNTGDLLMMDAHQWHANTPIRCTRCDDLVDLPGHSHRVSRDDGNTSTEVEVERISLVCYYRTRMAECGDMADENAKRAAVRERRNAKQLSPDPEGALA